MSIRTYEYSCLNLSSRGTSTNRFLNGNPVRVTIPDSFIAYSKFFRMNTAFSLFFLYYILQLYSQHLLKPFLYTLVRLIAQYWLSLFSRFVGLISA